MNSSIKPQESTDVQLPNSVLEKMDDEEIATLMLGENDLNKKSRVKEKIVGLLLWSASVTMQLYIGPSDSSAKIMGLSTIGLLLVATNLPLLLSSYNGPTWPIAGRFGQYIDASTPPVVLRFFGWLLLVISIIIFGGMLWKP
ncbi:MAG: hypothetical protein ACYC8S_01900 [Minisyncoccota bacterium]